MFELKPYLPELAPDWDRFVAESKNGTFLLTRQFMDYHADRFRDCSLMVYRRGKLHALLPASAHSTEVRSHGGLTYGGLILGVKATADETVETLRLIVDHYRRSGFSKLIYRPTPHIYHRMPAEEDLYALFRLGATLAGRDAAACIFHNDHPKMRDIRKAGVRKALAAGITVNEEVDNFGPFWNVLSTNLHDKYGVGPVHSLEEINLLRNRFPRQIRLHTATRGSECLAGAVIFLTERVAHVQYISASPEGKRLGALDLLFSRLIGETYAGVPYFDFGKSTEGDGSFLNADLMYQKEGFGGRTVVYDTYNVNLL